MYTLPKNISHLFSDVRRQIRNFLLSNNSRELLIFVFFLFVSFCFWGLRTLNETYQSEVRIPFRITGIPKDVIITSGIPDVIVAKVEDRGTILLNYAVGDRFNVITLPYSSMTVKGNQLSIPPQDIQRLVNARLNSTTKIVSMLPETFDFMFAKGAGKRVPVVSKSAVDTHNRYYISSVNFHPDTVVVYAPPALLAKINTAEIESISMQGVTENFSRNVSFVVPKGVKVVPEQVQMDVIVDMYSEKTIEVPVVGINFPEGKQLRTFPSKVKVTSQVGLKAYKRLSANDFIVSIDWKDILKADGDKVKPTLKVLSADVNHARVSPSVVEYLIEEKSKPE